MGDLCKSRSAPVVPSFLAELVAHLHLTLLTFRCPEFNISSKSIVATDCDFSRPSQQCPLEVSPILLQSTLATVQLLTLDDRLVNPSQPVNSSPLVGHVG